LLHSPTRLWPTADIGMWWGMDTKLPERQRQSLTLL
jgi:hypothetical protein